MQLLGEINERQVFYIEADASETFFGQLPTKDWLLLPICDEKDYDAYLRLANSCIDKNVVYMCALGSYCELLDDIFDDAVLIKKINNGESIESPDDFEDAPMTTWHHNFDEGFWFSLFAANDGDKLINKVVCIDFTSKGVKNYLIKLLNKMQQGWLPSDDAIQLPKYDS